MRLFIRIVGYLFWVNVLLIFFVCNIFFVFFLCVKCVFIKVMVFFEGRIVIIFKVVWGFWFGRFGSVIIWFFRIEKWDKIVFLYFFLLKFMVLLNKGIICVFYFILVVKLYCLEWLVLKLIFCIFIRLGLYFLMRLVRIFRLKFFLVVLLCKILKDKILMILLLFSWVWFYIGIKVDRESSNISK